MKQKVLITLLNLFFLLLYLPIYAQVSGNQVYGNSNYSYNRVANIYLKSVQTTDSTLFIQSRVMLNKKPDFFMVSLGVSQEAATIEEGLKAINARIDAMVGNFNQIGVDKEDYYIDFISQTKVYDYVMENNTAEQVDYGFEIKKNIIIKLAEVDKLDKLIELASQQQIYDVIKVDYRNYHVEEIYEELLETSMEIVDKKKELYLKHSSMELDKKYRIVSDNFYSIYPNSQYKKYQAYESSDVNMYSGNRNNNFVKKELRKATTFYYEGSSISGLDKVINSDLATIGIQYFLEVMVLFEVKK